MIRTAIAIDLGGTHLRTALMTSEGKVLRSLKVAVGKERGWERVFGKICEVIREVGGSSLKKVVGIGLGLPGICDPQAGIVYQLPHYPEWRDVPARAALEEVFSLPVALDNDANMGALGERWLGAGRGLKTFVLLTLGTGIGGALFMDGGLWRGESGFAGELGHMVVEPDGRLCACGKRGCWEMYAASSALPNENQGWDGFGKYLGLGIANLTNILDIDTFIVGGGITNSYDQFMDPTLAVAKAMTYQKKAARLRILRAELGEESNLFGAAISIL